MIPRDYIPYAERLIKTDEHGIWPPDRGPMTVVAYALVANVLFVIVGIGVLVMRWW